MVPRMSLEFGIPFCDDFVFNCVFVVLDSSVCSKHFRDMIYFQTDMARLFYDAADATARYDNVLSLFLRGEVAHCDLKFNATLARAVRQPQRFTPVQRFPIRFIATFISSTLRALRALIKCIPGTSSQFTTVIYESGAHLLCFCARRSRIRQIL
jgi:hypothetical protein